MIRATVESVNPGGIQNISGKILSEVKKIIRTEAVLLTGYTRKQWLSGPRPVRLGVRTGDLRANTKPLPLRSFPGGVESGVGFGTKYAATHVGPKGQVTTIKAKNAKYLAIPLEAAMTKALVSRGSPRSGAYGETFVARSKRNNLIIFGRLVAQKGKHAGQTRGQVVPLFVLKKQVKIRTRVYPEQILAWEMPRLIQAFKSQIGVTLRRA